ncbi:MAG TPA: hypothetical protein VGR62_24435 [Candidatus Binatia bacterium]|jgi:hypothetical protein|nr:hypothetical protein [Candidatus Binatia bacterium]
MYVVALRQVDGTPEALAEVMGSSIFDARPHLHARGPRVLATFAANEDATRLATALVAAKFDAFVLDLAPESQVEVVPRSFVLRPDGVQVTLRDGLPLAVRFDRIQVLLRGTRMAQERHTEVTHHRKLSIERAVLTGGLIMTKTEKKEVTRTIDQREGFLHVRAAGVSAVELRESELLYDGLGAQREPTRTGNFAKLVAILREGAPQARWDDRMLARAGQLEVLGTVLTPENDLDVAIAVLDHVLRPTVSDTAA